MPGSRELRSASGPQDGPGSAPPPWVAFAGRIERGEAASVLKALQAQESRGADSADYWALRGAALGRLARADEALVCLKRALQLEPKHALALFNGAEIARYLGDRAQSVNWLRTGQALAQGTSGAALWLERLWWSERQLCDWQSRETALSEAMTHLAQTPEAPGQPDPFAMLVLGLPEPVQLGLAQRRAQRELAQVAHYEVIRPPVQSQDPNRPLRVGWLSADFHEHATLYLLLEVLEQLDKRQCSHTFYTFGPQREDAYRRRLRTCGAWVNLAEMDSGEAAAHIASDAIDILVDLKGYTAFARPAILALRPAPVQVQWLGYPGSMGAPWIDWIVADEVVLPGATPEQGVAGYSEKVLYLPEGYQPNAGLRYPTAVAQRRDWGLPEQALVLASMNAPYKLEPVVWGLWMQMLRAEPRAVLWLLADAPEVQTNLRAQAVLAGVDPARLVFAPQVAREQHLARLSCADLALDPLAMGGHTTTSDMLRMGVPVLTVAGQTFGRRVAASLLRHAGLDHLVFDTPQDLLAAALRLLKDDDLLRAEQRRVAVARAVAPTFDSERFARTLNAGLRLVWQAHANGDERRCLRVPRQGRALPAVIQPAPAQARTKVPAVAEVMELIEASQFNSAWDKAVQAWAQRPLGGEVLGMLGFVRYRQGRHHEAALLFEQALASMPRQDAQWWHNLGSALESAQCWAPAERAYRQALALQPERVDSLGQLGCLLRNLGRVEDAVQCHGQALALQPADAQTLYVHAGSLYQAGQVQASMDGLRHALALQPDLHEARSNLGIAHLLRGEFDPGWDEFEARWQSPSMKSSWAPFPAPAWDGSDLGRRILMVWAEQGLGDNIQFVRYLGLLRHRYPEAVLLFWGPKAMARLCGLFFQRHCVTFLPREQAPNPALIRGMDCHVPVMGLPRLMGTRLDTIPGEVPGYLALAPQAEQAWQARLRALESEQAQRLLNVGLVWSGQREGLIVEKRNIHPRMLEPWLKVPGVRWFSLQIGAEQAEQAVGTPWESALIDWTADIHDFADTASFARALDLVISVDTSTVHAASAVGARVWMLSRFDGCWRWLQERSDSPWYPSLHIFRQPAPRAWSPVVEDVRAALVKEVSHHA